MKRIAVCLYGHCRTFELTYENFFRFIIEANKEDGYEVDVFFHIWDVYHSSFSSWHRENRFLNEVKLSPFDVKKLICAYSPKKYIIEKQRREKMPSGFVGAKIRYAADFSVDRVNCLREAYEKENGIQYDYVLYTRMDVMFLYPFKINTYLNSYKNKELQHLAPTQGERILFSCNNAFTRFNVADPRYPNESDLIWFSNFSSQRPHLENVLCVLTNYRMHCHFYVCRSNFVSEENIWRRLDKFDRLFAASASDGRFMSAKARVKNQLCYQLGQEIILSSKSLFGYVRMPFVLWHVASRHQKEQKIYRKAVRKNPSLKLPPLKSYPDYMESLKYKSHLSYKLGKALIRANNTSFMRGGGYIGLLFEIWRLRREFLARRRTLK